MCYKPLFTASVGCRLDLPAPCPLGTCRSRQSLSTRWPLCHYCLILAVDTCPHSLFGFVGRQADTEAGTANAGALDQTISKYKQEKSGVSAACASPWVFIAHNNTPKCTSADAFRVPSPQAKYWLGFVFWTTFSHNRLPAIRGGGGAKGKTLLRTHECKKLHMGDRGFA